METQTFTLSMYSDLSGFGLWKSNLGQSMKNNLSECEFFRKSLFSIVSLYTRYCCRTTGWNLEGLKRSCLCCLWPIIQFNNISEGLDFPHAALNNPVAQLTVNLQTLGDWKMKNYVCILWLWQCTKSRIVLHMETLTSNRYSDRVAGNGLAV